MAKSSKNIRKTSKYSNKTKIRRIKYYYIEKVLDEYTQFSTSFQFPCFLGGFLEWENEISRKLGRGSNF